MATRASGDDRVMTAGASSRVSYASSPGSGCRPHRRLLWLVAALNLVVLILTAEQQIYDTNFYSLWEATALLAGDHPYRDFFEWGIPGFRGADCSSALPKQGRQGLELCRRALFGGPSQVSFQHLAA